MSRVFISYRWENEEFRARVRAFAERLRESEIDVALDQFYSDEHPGGPDEGWGRWCSAQVQRAGRVLIVCSGGWFRAFEGKERPGEGLGAAYEARLIHTELYEGAWRSGKHRLLMLEGTEPPQAPLDLRHITRFQSDRDYDRVVGWIQELAKRREAVESPAETSWPEALPDYVPDLADRDDVWEELLGLLTGSKDRRILLLEGETNHGKSGLVRECISYARNLGVGVVRVDFKGGQRTLPEVLKEFDLGLGDDLPQFHDTGGKDPYLLRGDLRRLSRPVLVLLDTYEQAMANPEVTDWVEHQFMADVELAPALAVVVAGQKCPDWGRAAWRDQARHLLLGRIDDPAPWEEWVARRFPALAEEVDIRSLLLASDGIPGTMAGFCATIAAKLAREGH